LQKEFVEKMKKELPEPWTKKLVRFQSKYRLSEDLAKQIIRSEHLEFFEKIVDETKAPGTIVANFFISTIKDLEKREKVELNRLREEHYIDLFENIAKGRIVKEAIPVIIKFLSEKPGETANSAIKELNLEPLNVSDLKKVIEEVLKPGLTYEKAVGIVMSKVRGRIEAEVVMQQVKKLIKS
jgi:glutamyl-tRNA(Gln) amidotransferase subunit E